jgi:hypothetical protein
MKMTLGTVALAAVGVGVAGWALENALFGPRYSRVLGTKNNIPLLPVYAAGGAAVAIVAPHIQHLPWQGRALVYGSTLTAIEAAAGYAERAEGRKSWDYDGSPVDVPHAVLWAGLGLGVEGALKRLQATGYGLQKRKA